MKITILSANRDKALSEYQSTHLPRVGDSICHGGVYYRVNDVIFNYDSEEIQILTRLGFSQ